MVLLVGQLGNKLNYSFFLWSPPSPPISMLMARSAVGLDLFWSLGLCVYLVPTLISGERGARKKTVVKFVAELADKKNHNLKKLSFTTSLCE